MFHNLCVAILAAATGVAGATQAAEEAAAEAAEALAEAGGMMIQDVVVNAAVVIDGTEGNHE